MSRTKKIAALINAKTQALHQEEVKKRFPNLNSRKLRRKCLILWQNEANKSVSNKAMIRFFFIKLLKKIYFFVLLKEWRAKAREQIKRESLKVSDEVTMISSNPKDFAVKIEAKEEQKNHIKMEIKEENLNNDEDKAVKVEVKEEQKTPIKAEIKEEIISSDEEFDVEIVGFKY